MGQEGTYQCPFAVISRFTLVFLLQERRLPSALSQEIKRSSVRRLRHVEQPGYIPSGINFGRVVDLRTASYTKRAVPTTGYVRAASRLHIAHMR